MKTEIANRILALRAEMKKAGVDAVIIPQTDPHQSEYLAAHWQVRRWLSGFTGSAGDLVVTADDALLWTDSRYFLQAARQLEDTDIKLMKDGLPDTPSINHYLTHTLKKGAKVGIDGALFNLGTVCALRGVLEKRGMTLATDFDATDTIWEDRPDLPEAMVFVHDVKYAGETAASKIAKILAEAAEQGANATLVSALDEIAWTLNIRSRDVNCNPVATAFLYLSAKGSILFIKPEKIDDATAAYLKEAGVEILPYSEVYSHMSSLRTDTLVLVDATRTSVKAIDSLGSRAVVGASPIPMLKATKNDVQIAGIRKSMEIDGAALVGAFMEIEKRMAEGTKLTEMNVADILTQKLHFAQVFKVVELLGNEWAKDELIHIPYGLVSLEGAKLSSRNGNIIYAEDILKDAIAKSLEIITEKSPNLPNKEEVAKMVGVGAILFNDLYNQRIKDVSFSWDKVLNFDGETGPYVQYTHARCSSIIRLAEGFNPDMDIDYHILAEPDAMELLKEISRFPKVIADAAEKYEPSIVARFAVDVAQAFNKFYNSTRINVPEENIKNARVMLTYLTKKTIRDALSLLGIAAPEAM